MSSIYNYQPFVKTIWFGPTDARQARVKAINLTSGASIIVKWDHNLDPIANHMAAARKLYEKLEQEIPPSFLVCGTQDNRGYIFTEAKGSRQ